MRSPKPPPGADLSAHGPGGPAAGRWLVGVVSAIFLALVAPVVFRGGLLADEYVICLRPVHDGSYGPFLEALWYDWGIVRPARFIELFLITETCTRIHYGLVMLVPLGLKLATGLALWALLRDLRVPSPWPEIGVALWFLEPLGTEAALWSAALHVPLGLALVLLALRLYRRGSLVWAAVASLGAAFSVEQVIFALPVAVWLLTPPEHRLRATLVAGTLMALVVVAYATWSGDNVRHALTLGERIQNVLAKREWYVFFPLVGLGFHSGAMAFLWAFPYGIVVVLIGAAAGALIFPVLVAGHVASRPDRQAMVRAVLAFVVLLGLVNLPLVVTEVGYSGRTFTPTWVLLCAAVAMAGPHVPWRRARLAGALAGTFTAFALLSIALSVTVRVRTDTFNRAAAQWVAERTSDGDVIALCDVGRTVVDPAPLGAFHLHAFHSTWGAWIEFHTGRRVTVRRSGERYWGAQCPDLEGADLVISFPQLVTELTGDGRR
jgi:hypothetical protein